MSSDETFHAFWTYSNNRQTVVCGVRGHPPINLEDVVSAIGNFRIDLPTGA